MAYGKKDKSKDKNLVKPPTKRTPVKKTVTAAKPKKRNDNKPLTLREYGYSKSNAAMLALRMGVDLDTARDMMKKKQATKGSAASLAFRMGVDLDEAREIMKKKHKAGVNRSKKK